MATYEIARNGLSGEKVELVSELPPLELGAVLFLEGQFWLVERIDPAHNGNADGRLTLALTTDEPAP